MDDPAQVLVIQFRHLYPNGNHPSGSILPCIFFQKNKAGEETQQPHLSELATQTHSPMPLLSPAQPDSFLHNGFLVVDNAFPAEVAAECREILWKATGCDPNNPES